MRKFIYSSYPIAKQFKQYMLPVKVFSILFLIFLFSLSTRSFGQAGDLSQLRNGNGKSNQQGVLDTCGSCWVNGNAGSSNAHYAESMSIAYRSLLTGLTPGVCYVYEMGYDTYHGAMAIDYLTHFQRLEPHGPLGHIAEVVKPLRMVSGNNTYDMFVIPGGIKTFDIPTPAASGIASGVFDKNGIPKDVSLQAVTSFNALPAAERKMTIYNGLIEAMTYSSQAPIVLGGADAETKILIRFRADDDSVLLAWGGHIASRHEWGYTKDSKGKLSPLSAGGISGSPYHMRQKTMNVVDCGTGLNPVVVSGFGNQDRSLSAAAVSPPPDCPTVTSQTICAGGTSFTFTIASPPAGTNYVWSFGSNTIDAVFQGGTNTGTSVTVVKNGGGAFTTGGSFTLNITATLNFVSQECLGVATGTVEKVVASASASPTQIDITSLAHSTTLTADIAAGSTDLNNANYNYLWEIVTAGTTGSLTNATSRIATYTTVGVGDAGSSITFKVTATQKDDPNSPECSDDETVGITVNSIGGCDVSAQAAVCQGTVTTHNGSPSPKPTNATYTWSLGANGGGAGGTTSTLVGGNSGTATQQVNANQSYRITLTQVYLNTALNTSCFEDVEVVPTPSVNTQYNAPSCSQKTFTVDVTNPVNGYTYTIDQPGNNDVFSPITPSAGSPAVQFTGLKAGDGYTVTVTTTGPGCTATSSCATNNEVPLPQSVTNKTNIPEETTVARSPETYEIVLGSPTKVTAVPNPFTDKIRFNMVSAVSGRGSLELYNAMGQRVGIVYEGYIQAGREFIKEYNIARGSTATLIYVFKVGDQKATGKLIGLK